VILSQHWWLGKFTVEPLYKPQLRQKTWPFIEWLAASIFFFQWSFYSIRRVAVESLIASSKSLNEEMLQVLVWKLACSSSSF